MEIDTKIHFKISREYIYNISFSGTNFSGMNKAYFIVEIEQCLILRELIVINLVFNCYRSLKII